MRIEKKQSCQWTFGNKGHIILVDSPSQNRVDFLIKDYKSNKDSIFSFLGEFAIAEKVFGGLFDFIIAPNPKNDVYAFSQIIAALKVLATG